MERESSTLEIIFTEDFTTLGKDIKGSLNADDNDDLNSELEEEVDIVTEEEKLTIWFGEEENIVKEYPVEIRLRPPRPGTKIAYLVDIIESKMSRREGVKPSGGVDPFEVANTDVDTLTSLGNEITKDDEVFLNIQAMQDPGLGVNTGWPDYAATI